MMKKILLITTFILSTNLLASIEGVYRILAKEGRRGYPKVIKTLIDNDLYFSSIPFIKEYLTTSSGSSTKGIDSLIDEVVVKVGVKQFEVLPTSILKKSKAPIIKYILARKYFRTGKLTSAANELKNSIPYAHPTKPFALFLEGSILSIRKQHGSAREVYKDCIGRSNYFIKKTKNKNRLRQLNINKDYCVAGIARAEFAGGKYSKANLSYMDIPKSAYIWPEILFEEAWNSFYLKDYNRTLGKLVSYKAPVFDYIFNPEVEILKALTYLELCLWDDVKETVDDFFRSYEKSYGQVRRSLKRIGRSYKTYYLLSKKRRSSKVEGGVLFNRILKQIVKDAAYIELYDAFQYGNQEIEMVRQVRNTRLRKILGKTLRDTLLLQRNLIGAYVRKNMRNQLKVLAKSLEGMSYIRLEVLSRKKELLYRTGSLEEKGKRGDVKYVKRTDKQYFWSFNGEFWADELGDYVFALGSECK